MKLADRHVLPPALVGIKRNPLGHVVLEQKLRTAGFRGEILSDEDAKATYSTDESIFAITPQLVLIPEDAKDIETATKLVAKETYNFPHLSLTPRAAGTGLSGGSLTDSIVIDVKTHCNRIGDVKETKDGVRITCEPGAMWRDVETHLKKHGYYIPSYPASKDICTIGGAVGNNAAGPDSLRFGHTAEFVESLRVILNDGKSYTIKPLSYKEFKRLTKQKTAYAEIAREIFKLIEANEKSIQRAEPMTAKNTAGYALWDVLDTSVASFKRGNGTFNLTRLIAGSQGTLGIITEITLTAEPITNNTTLIAVPVFDLQNMSKVIEDALDYDPINIEIYDGISFDLALQNPSFFLDRLTGTTYLKTMLALYTTYHVRYKRNTPEFTVLITLDNADVPDRKRFRIIEHMQKTLTPAARIVTNPFEVEMYWQIRRASYLLAKMVDPTKRPAAFLEDMTVPPKHITSFLRDIKRLLREFNVSAAVHGHGGNGHFHFYPLIDFTNKTTPKLIERMSDAFFESALKYGGSLCGEHNDGIIRTPHLHKMFTKKMVDIFEAAEHIFDPDDIFNPGKKVNPRYNIKDTLRTKN